MGAIFTGSNYRASRIVPRIHVRDFDAIVSARKTSWSFLKSLLLRD